MSGYENMLMLLDSPQTSTRNRKRSKMCLIISWVLTSVLVVVVIFLLIFYCSPLNSTKKTCPLPTCTDSFMGIYKRTAVASDAKQCASVSNTIISVKGGNAIDGAIAGLLCTCSVNFHSCGIAGGSLLLYYKKAEKKIFAFDIREMAPQLATPHMFENGDSSVHGGKSIAVTGLVAGYYEIHRRFGKINWKTLFEPTIDILEMGFPVSETIEEAIDYFFNNTNPPEFKELRDILTNPITGKPKRVGDIIKTPKLAQTMRILSVEPYAMKNGSLVNDMIAEMTSGGSIILKDDLLEYKMKEREPISVRLGDDSTLYTLPPPSSGVLVAFSLNVLTDYKFDPSSTDSCENLVLFYHRLIETMKFSFAKRSCLGDIDFLNNTDKELLRNLTSERYSKEIMSLITDKTHEVSYYQPSHVPKEDHGTSHFSLVSPDGDAVSVTSTINYLFGSFIMGSKTGIVYNDEMDDFATNKSNTYGLPSSPNNFIERYKRPMSSMSPIIIVDKEGNVTLVIGASGGSKILSSTIQTAVVAKLLKKNIKESIDFPRVHNQLFPNEVVVEQNFPDALIKSLVERGHVVNKNLYPAVVQGIMKSLNPQYSWQCNADHRKKGICDGT